MFRKKAFGGCKSKKFVFGYKNAGRRDCIAEARRRSVWHGDDFDWLVAHSANQEAPEVNSRGSWLLCTSYLTLQLMHLEPI